MGNIICYILVGLIFILAMLLIMSIIYMATNGKIFKFISHDILGWHIPEEDNQISDGVNLISRCKICGQSIIQDSQGNWF